MPDHKNNKRIIKNTLFLYFRMIITLLLSLYTSRVILKALGVDDYGICNVVAGIVTMLSFMSGAMTSATQRFFSYEHGEKIYICIYYYLSMVMEFVGFIQLAAILIMVVAEGVKYHLTLD